MGSAIAVGALVGLVVAIWAVAVMASSRATGIVGGLLAVALVLAPIAYFVLPDSIAPKPGEVARAYGWVATTADGIAMATAILVVAVAGYVAAAKLGLVRRLTSKLDRGDRSSDASE